MTKDNFALMSVLYDNKGANLYNDIYFPIIKYAIATLYNSQDEEAKHYDLETLQKIILDEFGITIPLVVLKQALKAVQKINKEVSLTLLNNGNHFKINKAWDRSISQSVEIKLNETVQEFNELEGKFQEYLQNVQIETKKTLLGFFSDNSNEVYKYLNDLDSTPIVSEEHIHLVKFLLELKETNKALFNVVNNIFWGSIVSAFLKRNVDLNIKPSEKVRYYLDTSLILSILDLDSVENVKYSTELLEMIIKSGNLPYVHPLTLREVENILNSVERDAAPMPHSAIEGAYYRKDLSPSKILRIKSNLNSTIESLKIIIEPCSHLEVDKIQNSYKNNNSVRRLKETRGGHMSTSRDNIRDIHDIFMNDHIQKKRGTISSSEKINSYFVSLNTNLLDFLKTENKPRVFPSIVHPSKVISTLWIHNSECSLIKDNGLTEIMSRCFALNNTDIQRKLRVLSKYFTEEELNEEDYKLLYFALIDRSNKVLKEVELIEEEQSKNTFSDEKQVKKRREKILNLAKEEFDTKQIKSINTRKQVEELEKKLEEHNSQNKSLITDIETVKEQSKNDLIKFRQRIAVIDTKLNEKNAEKSEIMADRERVTLKKENSFLALEILFALILFGSLIYFLYLVCNIPIGIGYLEYITSLIKEHVVVIICFCASFLGGGILSGINKTSYILNWKSIIDDSRKVQIEKWDEENPKYAKLMKEIEKLNEDKKELLADV